MIVLDTSVAYALLDGADHRHDEVAAWYAGADEDLVTTPLVIAEIDYLAARAGKRALQGFRRDLGAGAYGVEWHATLLSISIEVAENYDDLGVGLTDASLVALASRVDTNRIATLDERHFRAMRPISGDAGFHLLPADA